MARPSKGPRISRAPEPGPRYAKTTILAGGLALAVAVGGLWAAVSRPVAVSGGTEPSAFEYSGVSAAGPLRVEGSHIEMGQVPLDVSVNPTWTITNTAGFAVALGEPHASVIEGCCPGPLTLGMTELGPGEITQLSFSLQMHEGMDGPHTFEVHVPIIGNDEILTLSVSGDFQ